MIIYERSQKASHAIPINLKKTIRWVKIINSVAIITPRWDLRRRNQKK